jgi:hypothetical protein
MSNLLGPVTRAGYVAFLRRAGINSIVLPDDSFSIDLSLKISEDIVSLWLEYISCDIYTLAVYNLATDRLIHFQQDNPILPDPQNKFWTNLRKDFSINAFIAGVIRESHDESTGQSIEVPDSLKNLSLLDLQTLQTSFGRAYMAYAQQIGSLWGLS